MEHFGAIVLGILLHCNVDLDGNEGMSKAQEKCVDTMIECVLKDIETEEDLAKLPANLKKCEKIVPRPEKD